MAEPFEAALAALMHFAVAGERAALHSAGPGSFVPAFVDALALVQPEDMDLARVRRA
ncbi:carbohydrate kinase family protein [Mangrovicoccus ximenensis]|uniref:hydroxyethylthiazole kinase n=1 Tax=Mangrovicoccus ximenensis TaxID=1911570 RepID=UPI001EFF728B